MALTFDLVEGTEIEAGRLRGRIYDITLDSSYPTGGEAILPKEVGLGTIIFGAQLLGGNAASGAYKFHWDTVNGKLMAFTTASSGALTAHTHTLHFQTSAAANAVTAEANQLRTAAAAFDVAGVADSTGEGGVVATSAGTVAAAALAELANGSSLATSTVRVLFFGI